MRLIKTALLASIACAIAAPVMAADLSARPVYQAPAPVAAAVFSWTGFYLGGNLGAKWGRFDDTLSAAPIFPGTVAFPRTESDTSFLGGGQIGYLWQAGPWVLGIEADIDSTRLSGSVTAVAPVPAPFVPGDSLSIRNTWQSSVRGRLGWAFDRTLLYVTGGGAWANLKTTATFVPFGTSPGLTVSNDRTVFGWTLGGGVDYMLLAGWSLGAEYRFTRFDRDDNFSLGTLPLTATTSTPINATRSLDTHEVTARISYHFGGGSTY
jgi:outer membrane immunogenic protein